MSHKMLGSGHMWMSNTTCLSPNITTCHAHDKRSKGDYRSKYQGTCPSPGEYRDGVRDLTLRLRAEGYLGVRPEGGEGWRGNKRLESIPRPVGSH